MLAVGLRIVIDPDECFSPKVQYEEDTVHASFVVIKAEAPWHYGDEGVDLVNSPIFLERPEYSPAEDKCRDSHSIKKELLSISLVMWDVSLVDLSGLVILDTTGSKEKENLPSMMERSIPRSLVFAANVCGNLAKVRKYLNKTIEDGNLLSGSSLVGRGNGCDASGAGNPYVETEIPRNEDDDEEFKWGWRWGWDKILYSRGYRSAMENEMGKDFSPWGFPIPAGIRRDGDGGRKFFPA
ncbi:hypothetical protein Syun_028252 [Stephania yunnanensis]|uniref:Uncharacterized protein n=1 Tax=Stephania yunnanensis TaxID=152371 RepID=A0AAP0EH09_9MAGN